MTDFTKPVSWFDPFSVGSGQFALNGERAIIATQSHLSNLVANGHSVQTSPRFFVRSRHHVAAGKWKALAVVYINWRRNTSIGASESDAGLAAVDIIGAGLEMVATPISGTRNFSYPNTGGPTTAITFGGSRSVRLQVGDAVVSDWILPSAFGLPFFEFTTRELAPWVRTAYGSTDRVAGIFLPSTMGPTTTSYFQQDYFATPADDAAALALTAPTGATSRITGLTFVNGQVVPTPVCLIGIPADGQKAVIILGTSRFDSGSNFSDRGSTYTGTVGTGDGAASTDGPADTTYLDLPGAACKWLQDPTVSAPFLQLATGAGNMAINWSTYTGDRPTTLSYENPGGNRSDGHRWFFQFGDVCLNEHGVNDVGQIGVGGYTAADYKAQHSAIATEFKRCSPRGRYIACFGPLSSFSTTADALNPATQIQANSNYTSTFRTLLGELVTEGKVDYIWDWTDPAAVGSGLNAWSWGVDASPLFTGTTRTGSTLNYVLCTGPETLFRRKEFTQCVARVDGVDRFILQNSGDEFQTTTNLPSAPAAGVTVQIFGNYSHDGLHPSGRGERRLAEHAKVVLNRFITPINRPNTP